LLFDGREQLVRIETPPVEVIEFAAERDVIVEPGAPELTDHVIAKVQTDDPSIIDVVKPLLVIIVFQGMKIEHIFPDQNELADILPDHVIHHVSFKVHDIVVYRVVPLADELNYGETGIVINIEYLEVKCVRSNFIPLGMDQVIVYRVVERELGIFPAKERGFVVFAGNVQVTPGVMRFNVVHLYKKVDNFFAKIKSKIN
jgi:hypothetical protein